MYGNAPSGDDPETNVTAAERKQLRQDLDAVAARTRALLPEAFAVGSELVGDANGLQATIAVEPPIGHVVSANYIPDDDLTIDEADRDELATGLAASAVLQAKEATSGDPTPAAK